METARTRGFMKKDTLDKENDPLYRRRHSLAHVLATEGLADHAFLQTYCTGYDRFERYLLGVDDGVPKSPQWAAPICGLDAGDLTALAHRMAAQRTIVTVSWSLQRLRHGEQAPWMGLTLAAMLGQIGLPGGGFGHGYGSMNEPGLPPLRCRLRHRHRRSSPTASSSLTAKVLSPVCAVRPEPTAPNATPASSSATSVTRAGCTRSSNGSAATSSPTTTTTRSVADRLTTIRRSRLRFEDDGWWLRVADAIGPDWIGEGG